MTEILFEFVRVGHSVKVTAIEPETKIEASVVVPDTLSQDQMKFQALNRLKYTSSGMCYLMWYNVLGSL